MIKAIITSILFFATSVYFNPSVVLAQQGIGCSGALGPFAQAICRAQNITDVGNRLNRLVSFIVGFLTIVAALWFFISFILAGYMWISAGGDKGQLEKARNKIFNALVGLLIVVSAWVIVGLIGSIVGLQILNPGSLLQNLQL